MLQEYAFFALRPRNVIGKDGHLGLLAVRDRVEKVEEGSDWEQVSSEVLGGRGRTDSFLQS
jgi:hypothetical protein